jgi:hypothetical protein
MGLVCDSVEWGPDFQPVIGDFVYVQQTDDDHPANYPKDRL